MIKEIYIKILKEEKWGELYAWMITISFIWNILNAVLI